MSKSNWGWSQDTKWYNAVENERQKFKHPCPHCGRKMLIAYKQEYVICDYCGNIIFKDEKAKFKHRMKRMLLKSKEDG